MAQIGYDKEDFVNLTSDQFDCVICQNIVRKPKECQGCGSLFCQSCIDAWHLKRKECPNRCDPTKCQITSASKALLRIYNELKIQCNLPNCSKVFSLSEIDKHLKQCSLPDCLNIQFCKNKSKPEFQDAKVCDLKCLLMRKLLEQKNNPGQWLVLMKEFNIYHPEYMPIPQSVIKGGDSYIANPLSVVPSNQNNWKWDPNVCGTGIEIYNNGTGVWLKEAAYMFRTVIGDTGFMSGVHYWEIIADQRTENELKIGISTRKDFNANSAFCDYQYGYAYYGLGQLRHNSNASGPQFGKRFKQEGVLGFCLNMNKGELMIALNNQYFGVAFSGEALQKGPIFPAAALLHCAGCQIDNTQPIPSYFPV